MVGRIRSLNSEWDMKRSKGAQLSYKDRESGPQPHGRSEEQGSAQNAAGSAGVWAAGVQSVRSTHQQVLRRLRFAHQNVLHVELQQGALQDRGPRLQLGRGPTPMAYHPPVLATEVGDSPSRALLAQQEVLTPH